MTRSQPVVVICGRPNVGKSTLFNRWVGRRKALVHRKPGMTRDRIEEDMGGYRLVDTGGIEFLSEDELSGTIRDQARQALQGADLILLTVDGAGGINPLDKDLSDYLHKLDVRVWLVVNKADVKVSESNIHEFSELGWPRIHLVSAEHGDGTGTLREEAEAFLGVESTAGPAPIARIAIVGKPNVRKSSLINRLLDQSRLTVSSLPGTTRDAVDVEVRRQGNTYVFVDTAGLRRKKQVRDEQEKLSVMKSIQSIERSDLCCLVVDASQPITQQDLSIATEIVRARKAVIVLANKTDLLTGSDASITLRSALTERLTFLSHAPILLLSARTGRNVGKIWLQIDRVLEAYQRRVPTGILNRLYADFAARFPSRQRKFLYITQAATAPPLFVLMSNRAGPLDASFSRFLENRIREAVDFPGTPILFKVRGRKPRNS